MARGVICDHCGKVVAVERVGGDDLDGETLLWIQVGRYQREPYDACSPACAQLLVDRVATEQADLRVPAVVGVSEPASGSVASYLPARSSDPGQRTPQAPDQAHGR